MLRTVAVLLVGALLGAGVLAGAFFAGKAEKQEDKDVPVVVEKIREVARLESLSVLTFKKISFEAEQKPADSTLGEIANWAAKSVYPRKGRAILFGDAHYTLDMDKLDEKSMRVQGKHIQIVLPPVVARLELRAGDTEIVESSLTPEQFAQMLESGRKQMELEVQRDPALRAKAKKSAERALRAFLVSAGFETVQFVDALPAVAGTG